MISTVHCNANQGSRGRRGRGTLPATRQRASTNPPQMRREGQGGFNRTRNRVITTAMEPNNKSPDLKIQKIYRNTYHPKGKNLSSNCVRTPAEKATAIIYRPSQTKPYSGKSIVGCGWAPSRPGSLNFLSLRTKHKGQRKPRPPHPNRTLMPVRGCCLTRSCSSFFPWSQRSRKAVAAVCGERRSRIRSL